MNHDPCSPAPSRKKAASNRVSEDVWDRARHEYLGGESGPAVCERYGIGLTTFRERARHDGWRRSDMKDSTLTSSREVLPASAAYTDLAAEAGMRMREALARGRASDVVSWMRVQDQLADRVGDDLTVLREARLSSPFGTGGLRRLNDQLLDLINEARAAGSDPDGLLDEALADIAAGNASLDEIETGEPGLRSS